MMERDLLNLFREAKDLPEFGGGFDVETDKRVWNRVALEIGANPNAARVGYGWKEYAQYAGHVFSHGFRQSFAYGLSILTLMLGGWVAGVNASFDSVPGDTLYPVKLVTEKMQITLATSTERRAKLHAEFAGRRLQEVAEISVSDRADKGARVKEAVASFKKELASAGEQLAELSHGNSGEAAAVAAVLEQKTDEYQSLLVQAEPKVTEDAKEDVNSAQQDVERTDAQAIDTLVDAHESHAAEPPRLALERSFGQDYQNVRNRISLSIGRLATVERVLTSLGRAQATEYRDRIDAARASVVGHENTLGAAQDFAAANGYRKAYELLRSVSEDVTASEGIVAALEIEITTAVAAVAEPAAPSVPDTTPVPEEPVLTPETKPAAEVPTQTF